MYANSILAEPGLTVGASVHMTLTEGRLVLALIRTGWADACRSIAEAPVWPEFGNADDDKLVW